MPDPCTVCFVSALAALAFLTLAIRVRLLPGEGEIDGWIIAASCALILALTFGLGLVRLSSLTGVWLALSLAATALAILALPRGHRQRPSAGIRTVGMPIIAVALLALAAIGPFPTYHLDSGRDQGMYLIQALVMVRTGGIAMTVPVPQEVVDGLAGVAEAAYHNFENARQHGLSEDPLELTVPFRQLSPVLFAVGYWAAGLEGLVRANAIVLALAAAMVAVVAVRWVSRGWAVAAAAMLLANASVVWVGRATFTEPLTMLINLTTLALVIRAFGQRDVRIAFLAGLVAGTATLNRWDGALTGLFIAGFAIYAAVWRRELVAASRAAAAAFAVVGLIGYLDGAIYSTLQMRDLGGLFPLILAVFIGSCVVAAVGAPTVRFLARSGVDVERSWQRGLVALCAAFAGWVVYRLVTGLWPGASFDARSLVEMAWYVTWPVIALLIVAPLLDARRTADSSSAAALVVLPAIAAVFVFTVDSHVAADHLWASRRWVPYCFPLILIAAVRALADLHGALGSRRPGLAVAMVVGVLALYGAQNARLAAGFAFRSLLSDYPDAYAELAATIRAQGEGKPALAHGGEASVMAAMLTYGYGVPFLTLTEEGVRRARAGELGDYVLVGYFPGRSGAREAGFDVPTCGIYAERRTGAPSRGVWDYCRRFRVVHGELSHPLPTLEPGTQLDVARMTGAESPLGAGWDELHVTGALLFGREAWLHFRVAGQAWGQCALSLSGLVDFTSERQAFQVTAIVDGALAATFDLAAPDNRFRWVLPFRLEQAADGSVDVRLSVGRDRDGRVGGPDDFGIRLQRIEFAGCESAGAAGSARTSIPSA